MWGIAIASVSGSCERIDVIDNMLIDCGRNSAHPFAGSRAYVNLGGGTLGNLVDVTCRNELFDTGRAALNGLNAVLALNGTGAMTRVTIDDTVATVSGLPLPQLVKH